MSASDAAPLPRLGEVYFDVRGDSRSMRLSWYADTGVAVFSIWQGGTCTGTFRLPIADLPRMVAALQHGPGAEGDEPPAEPRVPQDGRAGTGRAARRAQAEGDIQTGQHTAAFRPPGAADPATGPGMDAVGYGEDSEAFPPPQPGRHRDGPSAGYPGAGAPGGYPDGSYPDPDGDLGGYHGAGGPAALLDPLAAPGGRRSRRARSRRYPEPYEDDLSGRHAGEPTAGFGEDPLGGYHEDPPRAFEDGPAGRHGGPPASSFGEDPLGGYQEAGPEPYEGGPYGRHGGPPASRFGDEATGGGYAGGPATGYGDGLTGEYGPGEGIPGEYGPGEGIPGEYGPGDGFPGEYGPGDGFPGDYGPGEGIPGEYGPGEGIPGEYGPGEGAADGYPPEPATDDYPAGLAGSRFEDAAGPGPGDARESGFGEAGDPGVRGPVGPAHEYRDESPVRPYVARPRHGGQDPGHDPAVRDSRRERSRQPEDPSADSFPYGPPPRERRARPRGRYEDGR